MTQPIAHIHNRRYLGNKYALNHFIRSTIEQYCTNIHSVADVFAGTGAVASIFQDKQIITNDLLYCNYISHCAWFLPQEYRIDIIKKNIIEYNQIDTDENNYVRQHFADTYFSAKNCSKIGEIREQIEQNYQQKKINFKEYSILITSLLYGMDKIAHTVGHYDAYRKTTHDNRVLTLPFILPNSDNNPKNQCYHQDANQLVRNIQVDLLYLDPPYNSRQYSDAYHLLENIAQWQHPPVFGVAKKMDRTAIKSDYCTQNATRAFADLIEHAQAKYIVLSYNNMSEKGNSRSNAKISDAEIIRILQQKGSLNIFEQEHKAFSTGKSRIQNHTERLFLCTVYE